MVDFKCKKAHFRALDIAIFLDRLSKKEVAGYSERADDSKYYALEFLLEGELPDKFHLF